MRRRTRQRLASATAALAIAGGISACGSSSSAKSSAATTGSASATTGSSSSTGGPASGPTINIGLIGAFSGANAADWGGVPDVLNAWASSVNANGGLNGDKVQIVSKDTAIGTQPGLGYAKSLIDSDHVVAIVNYDTSPDDKTWLPYAQQQNVPVITAADGSTASLKDPLSFPVISQTPQTTWAFLAAAKTVGNTFGLTYCSEEAICSSFAQLFKSFATSVGVNMKVSVAVPSSAPDYTAACQDLKSVDSYYLGVHSATAQRIQDTCYQQGVRVPQILTSGTAAPYWRTDAAFSNSIVVDNAAPWFDTAIPGIQEYRAALKQYAPSILNTEHDNSSGVWNWAAGKLIQAAAATTSGPVTAASIINGLYSLHGTTLDGLTQPLTFVQGQPTWLPCSFIWHIGSGNKFDVSTPYPMQCASTDVLNTITHKMLGG